MTDTKKISVSAFKLYHTCPAKFDLHYNKRLRSPDTTSALLFGSAIDEALNAYLLKTGDYLDTFKENFKFEQMTNVEFSKYDADMGLFDSESLDKVKGKSANYIAWASLRIKGRLLLDEYVNKIGPLIEEVHLVQHKTKSRPGFIDAILTLKGIGKVLLDHKTSAWPYKDDYAKDDIQLAAYGKDFGLTHVGFIVLVKKINKEILYNCTTCGYETRNTRYKTCSYTDIDGKRCGGKWDKTTAFRPEIQLITERLDPSVVENTHSLISETEKNIEKKIFPKIVGQCGKMFGKKCIYYNYCWRNDQSGLTNKEE